ncbi:MAG: hypothetical protein A2174_02310 [Candidatus Portnoybacteria bacterium RBG_13_41_18]|uniref:Radical SAM core domain-containing protein n=1 Tax=Candidatus Portnoybacteria bacterium RBG_13_41_18 TaxID=1801991 RepID=A0A1G2F9K5_9BACT|nr:MAG: hypothetical protein A2174_02310 [Candidatus Portnoybacteria bacterium RBG_13_41_18]
MKVYLLNPPFIKNFIRSSRWARPAFANSQWYPIFLAYGAAALEKAGHKIKLSDALADDLDFGAVVEEAVKFLPDMTVIYTSWPSLLSDARLAEEIQKRVNCKIIFVGPWCAMNPSMILRQSSSIEGVIRQELELPLVNIAEGKDISEIKGITWKRGSEIVSNPDENFLSSEQLDNLPFVTDVYRRFLKIKNYRQTSLKYPFVDLFTGRGCYWGECTFCLWPSTIHRGAPKYRKRNIKNVIEELYYIKKMMPAVKEVFIQDDTLPPDRAVELSNAILENNLKIVWSCYAKPLVNYQTLVLMRRAGCRCLHVGYESADQGILQLSKKGQNIEIMEKFTKDAKSVGLIIHADFMIGLPGETEETILKTINWAKSLKLLDYQFAVLQPEQNSPVYDYLTEKKYLSGEDEINYPGLSAKELDEWRFKAYRMIYLDPAYLWRLLRYPSDFKRLFKMAIRGLPNLIK